MRTFTYERAADPASAITRFRAGAAYLGGGTNLVDLMRLGVAEPDVLVDVTQATSDRIEPGPGGGLLIGAAVRNSDLAADRDVCQRYPLLARAVLEGACGQIRNMATAGGNLLQRTRCPYFQDVTMACNKRQPGTGCQATRPGADTGNLAILGHSAACVATHPSDMAVALTALNAWVHVTGPDGMRIVAMPGLHRLPGDTPDRDTVLEPGELITAIELPPPSPGRSAYRKVRERASFAFALVSVAAVLDVGDGVVQGCKLALGGVAHVPWRCHLAERTLLTHPPTRDLFERAAREELAAARPLPGNGFKVTLAGNLIAAVLAELSQ